MQNQVTTIHRGLRACPTEQDRGILGNKLLNLYHDGLPIETLRPMLHDSSCTVVHTAVWVASELGDRASALLNDIEQLLKHSEKSVRYFSLDYLLSNSGTCTPKATAHCVRMLADPEDAVKIKAMQFLALAPRQVIESSIPLLRLDLRMGNLAELVCWLVDEENDKALELMARLNSEDEATVQCAAISALRKHRFPVIRDFISHRGARDYLRRFCERMLEDC